MFNHLNDLGTMHNLGAGVAAVRPAEYSETGVLKLVLNQVDYGLVVVDADSRQFQFANSAGLAALEGRSGTDGANRVDSGLRLTHGQVTTCRSNQSEQLRQVLQRTKTGLRGLLSLGDSQQASAIAVVPLALPTASEGVAGAPASIPRHFALLVLAKQQLCDNSTMALFARERGLTSAEGQVLAQVCKGLRPAQIADQHGVQISTVRTQLRSIRMKTCSETIRELVQKVSVLPPMARHLSGSNPA